MLAGDDGEEEKGDGDGWEEELSGGYEQDFCNINGSITSQPQP